MNPAVVAIVVVIAFLVIVVLANSLKILDQYQRGVVLTLGRFTRVSGPGLVILIPFIETMRRADLRVQVMPIPSQDVITRDNVSVKVSAVAFFSVVNPQAALLGVGDFVSAIAQLAPIALRANIGKHNLDELLSKQETLNKALGEALEERTKAWGVHVQNVEIRTVDLDPTMIRAMAQEAEAERGARARVITAKGEFDAAEKLAMAADMLSRNPAAMTLRTLATLKEIGAEQNSTIIFPVESLTSPAMSAAAMARAIASLEGDRGTARAAPASVAPLAAEVRPENPGDRRIADGPRRPGDPQA